VLAASIEHGSSVRAALREGVLEAVELIFRALAGRARTARRAGGRDHDNRNDLQWTFEQALTVVYRILFLLFAEARGLVPMWHPVYREHYTVEALRAAAERPGRQRGLWEALQALCRLAHAGCRAGSLRVTAFNGRLFSPARAPLADTCRIDDANVQRALLALSTRPGRTSRERISFGDLGVEQLGAVYESVLDFEPACATGGSAKRSPASPAPDVGLVSRGQIRKASGTFYTPQSITDYLVRHTLAPLVEGASPERILQLRVLDPAMGSGAFLVAACRYLAAAYECALVRDEGRLAGDISPSDRATFRRLVAQRCLYGVDINPFAVQVARLSLWLATLAAERPLVRVVDDQRGTPTAAKDLAEALLAMTTRFVTNADGLAGTYHFANAGETTWCGLAREIFRLSAARGGKLRLGVGVLAVGVEQRCDAPSPISIHTGENIR
jgi:hypothetical protein